MPNSQVIQVHQIEFDVDLWTTMHNVSGQLAPTARKTYLHDARHFIHGMADQALSLQQLSRDNLVACRAHLGETYTKATTVRMWAIASIGLPSILSGFELISSTKGEETFSLL